MKNKDKLLRNITRLKKVFENLFDTNIKQFTTDVKNESC